MLAPAMSLLTHVLLLAICLLFTPFSSCYQGQNYDFMFSHPGVSRSSPLCVLSPVSCLLRFYYYVCPCDYCYCYVCYSCCYSSGPSPMATASEAVALRACRQILLHTTSTTTYYPYHYYQYVCYCCCCMLLLLVVLLRVRSACILDPAVALRACRQHLKQWPFGLADSICHPLSAEPFLVPWREHPAGQSSFTAGRNTRRGRKPLRPLRNLWRPTHTRPYLSSSPLALTAGAHVLTPPRTALRACW